MSEAIESGIGEVTDRVASDFNNATAPGAVEYEQVEDGYDEPEYAGEDADPDWIDEPVWQEEQAQSEGWVDPTEAQAYVAYEQERAADVQQAQEHLALESGADFAVEQTRQALEAQGLRDVDPEVVALEANQQLQEIGIGLMNDGYSSDEALQLMRERGIPQAVLEAQAGAAKTWANYHTLERAFLREFRNVP